MKAPKLIIGNPETTEDGASFSRFVLPFRYCLEPLGPNGTTLIYKGVDFIPSLGDRTFERLHYLTIETANVLFERARWFELSSDAKACLEPVTCDVPLVSGTFSVAMSRPRIVLFELPKSEKASQSSARDACPTADDLLATGFLLVDLYFPEQDDHQPPAIDDLLRLNELFRYCRVPFKGHTEKYGTTLNAFAFRYSLPVAPSDSNEGNAGKNERSSDVYHDRWANLLDYPLRLDDDGSLFRLFPGNWQLNAAKSQSNPLYGSGRDSRGWVIHADNRAFVWTCAVVPEGTFALQTEIGAPVAVAPHSLGHWVKLLNVDPPGGSAAETHATSSFEQTWAEVRTYRRWEHAGTAYGFTTHSGALMVGQGHYATNFADMYFDQTLLLLFLRATTFRFSESLSRLSADMRSRQGILAEELRERFDTLRREFALFTNLYQFPLVSNQQQGLELYTLARKSLDVDDLFREVQQEIESTHSYIELRDTQRQTQTTTLLSYIGAFGLALGLAMAFLGMNVIIPDFKRTGQPCGDWSCVGWWTLENVGLFAGVTLLAGALVWFCVKLTRSLLGYPPLAWRTLSALWANRRRR